MNISKNSWHYKLIRIWFIGTSYRHHSNTLCGYMWQLFFAFIFMIVKIGGVAIGIALVIGLYLMPFISDNPDAVMFGVLIWGLTLISLGLAGYMCLKYNYQEFENFVNYFENRKGNRPAKPPSIFAEWIRAKKEKICPIIQYTRD